MTNRIMEMALHGGLFFGRGFFSFHSVRVFFYSFLFIISFSGDICTFVF